MIPKLLLSQLTGKVYIVTKYKDLGNGKFKSIIKYDITGEFLKIVKFFTKEIEKALKVTNLKR